jgi:hypothetical protein
MTHIAGRRDADLHHDDGTHRTTPASTRGSTLASHERRLARHLHSHQVDPMVGDGGPADTERGKHEIGEG